MKFRRKKSLKIRIKKKAVTDKDIGTFGVNFLKIILVKPTIPEEYDEDFLSGMRKDGDK